MDEFIPVIALMSATAATSVAFIATFIQRYYVKRFRKEIQGADDLLSDMNKKASAIQAEITDLGEEIQAFKTRLTEINYGGVEIKVTGPEFPPEKLEEMTADVIAAISKHLPEAHVTGASV